MASTFSWSESNGAGPTVTDGITNLNFGDVDAVNIVAATYPIVAGSNSYEKFIRAKFGGTFTEISNMKFWKSAGAYVTGEAVKAAANATYSTPVKTTSTVATADVPTAEGSALAINASGGGSTITAAGYSAYICLQKQTTSSTPAGATNSLTFQFQWDEI